MKKKLIGLGLGAVSVAVLVYVCLNWTPGSEAKEVPVAIQTIDLLTYQVGNVKIETEILNAYSDNSGNDGYLLTVKDLCSLGEHKPDEIGVCPTRESAQTITALLACAYSSPSLLKTTKAEIGEVEWLDKDGRKTGKKWEIQRSYYGYSLCVFDLCDQGCAHNGKVVIKTENFHDSQLIGQLYEKKWRQQVEEVVE